MTILDTRDDNYCRPPGGYAVKYVHTFSSSYKCSSRCDICQQKVSLRQHVGKWKQDHRHGTWRRNSCLRADTSMIHRPFDVGGEASIPTMISIPSLVDGNDKCLDGKQPNDTNQIICGTRGSGTINLGRAGWPACRRVSVLLRVRSPEQRGETVCLF